MAEKNSIGFLKEITGNAKIDEKIGEWLRMDKVRVLLEFLWGLFQSTHHSFSHSNSALLSLHKHTWKFSCVTPRAILIKSETIFMLFACST